MERKALTPNKGNRSFWKSLEINERSSVFNYSTQICPLNLPHEIECPQVSQRLKQIMKLLNKVNVPCLLNFINMKTYYSTSIDFHEFCDWNIKRFSISN